MIKRSHFLLYGACIPVEGIAESIIYDLSRCCYLPLSNLIYDVVHVCESNGYSIEQIKEHYNGQYDAGIDELFKYLYNKGYGFYTNEPQLFSKISLEWDAPYLLTNAIVEFDYTSLDVGRKAVLQLNDIGCQAIELRFLDVLSLSDISLLVEEAEHGKYECIFLYIAFSEKYSFEDILNLYMEHKLIGLLIIHSSPDDYDFSQLLPHHMDGRIKQVKKKLHSNSADIISLSNMIINIKSFTEAWNYNLGLNRKVSITSKGEIKRYLNHKKVFGYIGTDSIVDVINQKSFQEWWYVTKDRIEVCRDCQYRYMCVDNSEIVVAGEKYKRNGICDFNPYQNKWSKITVHNSN